MFFMKTLLTENTLHVLCHKHDFHNEENRLESSFTKCLGLKHWTYVTNSQVTSPFVTNVELAQYILDSLALDHMKSCITVDYN